MFDIKVWCYVASVNQIFLEKEWKIEILDFWIRCPSYEDVVEANFYIFYG